ncbi:hypothetical protein V8C86DRAFT_3024597 [Haematococcus lacustris]
MPHPLTWLSAARPMPSPLPCHYYITPYLAECCPLPAGCAAQKEIVMYAYFRRLDYFSTECVYAPFAARGFARDFIKALEPSWTLSAPLTTLPCPWLPSIALAQLSFPSLTTLHSVEATVGDGQNKSTGSGHWAATEGQQWSRALWTPVVEGSRDPVMQLSNGCLCCTVRDDLIQALNRLQADGRDLVIVLLHQGRLPVAVLVLVALMGAVWPSVVMVMVVVVVMAAESSSMQHKAVHVLAELVQLELAGLTGNAHTHLLVSSGDALDPRQTQQLKGGATHFEVCWALPRVLQPGAQFQKDVNLADIHQVEPRSLPMGDDLAQSTPAFKHFAAHGMHRLFRLSIMPSGRAVHFASVKRRDRRGNQGISQSDFDAVRTFLLNHSKPSPSRKDLRTWRSVIMTAAQFHGRPSIRLACMHPPWEPHSSNQALAGSFNMFIRRRSNLGILSIGSANQDLAVQGLKVSRCLSGDTATGTTTLAVQIETWPCFGVARSAQVRHSFRAGSA